MKNLFSKFITVFITLSFALSCTNMFIAHADESASVVLDAMYATTMSRSSSVSDGATNLSVLKTTVSSNSNSGAAFFAKNDIELGKDYIELDLYKVSVVDKLVFQYIAGYQRLNKVKVTYFDEATGAWKTKYDSVTITEASEDWSSTLTTSDIEMNVTTSRIRVYPLDLGSNSDVIRLYALQAYGTVLSDTKMSNLLSDSTVSNSGTGNVLWGSIDGSFEYDGSRCPLVLGTGENFVEYSWKTAKTVDKLEITHFYDSQGIGRGEVYAWDTTAEKYIKVCDVDTTQEYKWTDSGSGMKFERETVEFPYPVTTTKIKVVVTGKTSNSTHVSFAQVIASAVNRVSLGGLYFSSFDLFNTSNAYWTLKNGSTVSFRNPQGTQKLSGEDYIEFRLNQPSDVKQVVVNTIDDNNQKPALVNVAYLNHDTGVWVDGGELAISSEQTSATFNFAKNVYADAIRLYVKETQVDCPNFCLTGFSVMGNIREGAALNKDNVLVGSSVTIFNNGNNTLTDGKYDTFASVNNPAATTIWLTNSSSKPVNQIELVYQYASQGIKKGYITYRDANGEHIITSFELDVTTNSQLGGNEYNSLRHIISFPQTMTVNNLQIVVEDYVSANFNISEIIARNALNTGYDMSEFTYINDGNVYTLTTDFEEFDGVGFDYDMYYAAYTGNKMIAVDMIPVNLKPFTSRKINGTLDLGNYSGEITLKCFLWDSNMAPIISNVQTETINK